MADSVGSINTRAAIGNALDCPAWRSQNRDAMLHVTAGAEDDAAGHRQGAARWRPGRRRAAWLPAGTIRYGQNRRGGGYRSVGCGGW